MQLGLEDLEQSIAENQADQDAAEPARDPKPRHKRPARNHGALPAHRPRYDVAIDDAPEACPCCGGTLHCIGETTSEQLDIVPAQLRVRVTRRLRYACRSCEEAVVVAEAPARPINGGMPTEALIIHVLIKKYCDSAALSAIADAGSPGRRAGPLDAVQLGGHRVLVAGAALIGDSSTLLATIARYKSRIACWSFVTLQRLHSAGTLERPDRSVEGT